MKTLEALEYLAVSMGPLALYLLASFCRLWLQE
jgi:hypothetical protein